MPARRFLLCLRPLVLTVALAAAFPAHAATPVERLTSQTWLQVDSPHFRIVTDQPEQHARLMATDLENLRYISNQVRGTEAFQGKPLTIVAMGKDSFERIGLPAMTGGVFQVSRIGYHAIAKIEEYDEKLKESNLGRSTLLHEYHHFLMHMGLDGLSYPRWYDEGMAEYWSSLTIDKGMAWFGHPVDGTHRESWLRGASGEVAFQTEPLFNTLKVEMKDSHAAEHDAARFYAQARYAIHYFNSSPELRGQLGRYLQLHNHGYSQDHAVRLAFGKTYVELDRAMRTYVRRKAVVRGFPIGKEGLDLPTFQLSAKKLDRAATYAVLARVLPRFTRPGNKVDQELIATNLELNPKLADAWESALLEGHPLKPGAGLPELVKRFPQHGGLLAMYADGLRRYAMAQRAVGASGWERGLQQARLQFRQAVVAEPDTPLAYHGLGHLYEALPDSEAPDEAIVCLDTALLYEPDPASFLLLARFYLRQGKLPLALRSMRSAVAFRGDADRPLDALLLENLELLNDVSHTVAPPKPDGAGGLNYRSGAVYSGPLKDGKPEGRGKWLRLNGGYYEGEFVGGMPSGRGRLVSEHGVAYEGDFAAGIARGAGRISFPAASRLLSYEGAVELAAPSGAGILNTREGKLEASFLKGEAHGAGRFTPVRGAPLDGRWLYGEYDWPAKDGVLFTGDINGAGQRHGRGWCRAVATPQQLDACSYKDDQRVDLQPGEQD